MMDLENWLYYWVGREQVQLDVKKMPRYGNF